ncbi:hypothetical protein OIB37_33380 [Streptomyces sp. NBC_00820]|uniref:hypothetical protein n=1 Tax=Streptomyces sp. NBC_00820 TaxID=2975842 RepID=UPI002ED17983|nr:hypothetical protein OIB37_33380 [Streptomyces sp. NBC_00820]
MLRERSPALLEKALLGAGLGFEDEEGPRELMVDVCLHHVVATMLGMRPEALFTRVAGRLPGTEGARIIREFGPRDDVTPAAFAWTMADTPDGPDFFRG